MNTILKFPFYAKAALLLIGLYVFISMLSIGQDIILPVIYACIMAILINPGVKMLERRRVNRSLAIAITLTFALLIMCVIIGLLLSQASRLSEAYPQFEGKFQALLDQSVRWVSQYFGISAKKINAWVVDIKADMLNNSGAAIGNTLTTMGGILATVLLTPVYIFMLLFYQPHLVRFIHELFGAPNNNNVSEVLAETKTIVQSYLLGLFVEFLIITILNSIGLIILGIDYPVLLGIVSALLNVIPYIGGLVGVLLFVTIAMVTKSPEYVFYVIALYTVIQLIDNNYIVPKIVGSKVKLNAFVSIIAVFAGSALWGIPGMFLSIPLTAVIKLIFDRIEPLKPWGLLLGDTMPPLVDLNLIEISKKLPKLISK